ncbi:unnamed protein product [Chironomus riparius]|uniref:WD repeat-containing protein 63 n=1 Tax=Chironomus riparius TaxID=315576 RepID=A0A9N9WQB3_9DIPT|nr:unnamed protein product [Chironomus riparius]
MDKRRLTNTPIPIPPPTFPPDFALTDSDLDCSDEDDFDLLIGFDPEKAMRGLYEMQNSIILPISIEQQRDMFIEVGINLSVENPWKQISKQFLEDHLSTDTYEMSVLKDRLKEIDDDPLLLIGYVPHLSDETKDYFIIYLDEATCTEVGENIKRLEACERRKIMKSIEKYPRPYKSMGSEKTVDSYVNVKRGNTIDVELQSVYPMRYSHVSFQYRFSDDVRDGYVELLPDKKVHFDNVYKKMVDRSVQSASRMITEEQQTDPTFPTNAWSQYLYELEEVKPEDTETIVSEEKKEEDDMPLMLRRKKSKEEVPVEEIKPEEPVVSKQVEDLIQILEFNQIDMYRNDYKFIGKNEIAKYQTPYLEEVCCFADISKCKGRHIISMDWHPELSGICVTAYGFNLKSKIIEDSNDVDTVKQTIIEGNPNLVWSFDDPLFPKLQLESLREISCISFCPYDGNIIVGGTINGQIIIWDIKNRLERSEEDSVLTPTQHKHRNEIGEYLKWTKIDASNNIVQHAAISSIDKSHQDTVTSIKWLPRNYKCDSNGAIKEDRNRKTLYRHFVTTSMDGKIFFWDLDWQPDEKAKLAQRDQKFVLPDELKEESSPFKSIDKIFTPHYFLVPPNSNCSSIITFTFNEGEYQYEAMNKQNKLDLSSRVRYRVDPIIKHMFNPKMVVGSNVGELSLCFWEGNDFSQGAPIDQKSMNQEPFADVHDGPIISVERNKFMTDSFISIGGYIFAFWNDEYKDGPIFWRRRESNITDVQWSLDRPSVFFLTFEDGTLEIWDLHSRIDVPSLSESLGGYILTKISQHKLPLPRYRVLAVADHNSNLRIFKVPTAFTAYISNEKEWFINFIKDEVQRKVDQDKWKVDWFESNKDIVDAKKDVEQQMTDDTERKEKARKEIEDKRAQLAEAEARKQAKKNARKQTYDLPERLQKKWKEQNYKRLLKVIMERKKVDRELLEKQTKILKDRIRYDEEKKVAIKQSVSRIEEDLSTIRSRLIPVEEYKSSRAELVSENVDIMYSRQLNFKMIETDALNSMKDQPELKPMNMSDILRRCQSNRNIISQSLGGYNNSKFARFKSERQQSHSRYSSTSQVNEQQRT